MDLEPKNLQLELYRKEQLIRQFAIESLLWGQKRPQRELESMLGQAGLTFSSDWFQVVLVRVMSLDGPFFSPGKRVDERPGTFSIVGTALTNIFSEVLNQAHTCVCINSGDGIPLLLCLNGVDEANQKASFRAITDRLKQQIEETCSLIQRELGIGLQITLGIPCRGLSAIRTAYQNTYALSLYVLATQPAHSVYPYHLHMDREQAQTGVTALTQRYYSAMRRGDFHTGAAISVRIITLQLGYTIYNYATLRQFLLTQIMVAAAFRKIPLPTLELNQFLQQTETTLRRYFDHVIDGCGTLMQLEGLVHGVFSGLERLSSQAPEPSGQIRTILDFIQSNYADPALCASSLAAAFGKSLPQLSRAFHRDTGHKLIDYIHSVRLEAANQMLLETGRTVESIALAVGYPDSSSFIRCYKKYEGITPGLFRSLELGTAQSVKNCRSIKSEDLRAAHLSV